MAQERLHKLTVSPIEPSDHIVEGVLHFVVIERQNTSQHGRRARLLLVVALLARDEQASHHAGSVCRNANRTAASKARQSYRHCKMVASDRACCRVESRASVDSVP